jgi:hypothetical protein
VFESPANPEPGAKSGSALDLEFIYYEETTPDGVTGFRDAAFEGVRGAAALLVESWGFPLPASKITIYAE